MDHDRDHRPVGASFERFTLQATDGAARAGEFRLERGVISTPAFMPVGTRATVRGVTPRHLAALKPAMILANAFHLMLRPGEEIIARLGGLHRFMGWDGPMLTDSGGYQVFSLAGLRSVTSSSVVFRSPVDGAEIVLTPERCMDVQHALGADVIMPLDECARNPCPRADAEAAMHRTHAWLRRCVVRHRALLENRTHADLPAPLLFGIVQGAAEEDLRRESAATVTAHDLPGYAVGGLSVGEDRASTARMLEALDPALPTDRPRYLMGVGMPGDLLEAVARGMDLFDCVAPTRAGRHGEAFTSRGRLRLRNAAHRESEAPLDPDCACETCTQHSRAYLHHLVRAGEMLGAMLLTIHNVHYFLRLLEGARQAITEGRFAEYHACRVRGWARGSRASGMDAGATADV